VWYRVVYVLVHDMVQIASSRLRSVSGTFVHRHLTMCDVRRKQKPTLMKFILVLRSATLLTRMWADGQCDGHPAEYRWSPVFNTANFGWRPLLECRAVMLPRHKTRWNFRGCPKLPNRSQLLVGRSLLYYEDMWRRYCCLTSFFSDCRYMF